MKSSPIEPLEARYAPATLSIANASVLEGDSGTTKLVFTVTLSGAGDGPVTVDFATEDGTAKVAEHDYEALTGTLTFEPGQTSKTIEVNVIGDTIAEADETLTLKLTNPSGADLNTTQAAGTIRNDGVHLVGPTSFLEGDTGTKDITYTVRRETLHPEEAQTVHYTTVNGTALAGSDYVATSGDLVFAAGEIEKTFSVTINGDITSEGDETFKIDLTGGTSNNPITTPETTITIKDDGGVHFVGPVSFLEGDDTHAVTFTLRREGTSPSVPLTVHYSTADGTATVADNDYEATQGDLTFAAGETQKTFTINIKGDQTAEADETFKILLSGGEGFSTSTPETTVTIQNDGVHLVGPLSFLEGDEGTKTVTYTVRRETLNPEESLTVHYETVNGTATAGSDFVAASGDLTFAPNELEKTFSVIVNGDITSEGDETFKVKLSGVDGATIPELTTPETTVTIQDDGNVHFVGPVSIFEGDDNHAVTFTLRREGVSFTQPLTVHYRTQDGTATVADADYEAVEGDLTFAPGETQKTFTIDIKGDLKAEADETFKILLSGGEGFSTSTPETEVTIKNDGFHISDASVLEGDSGFTTMTFNVIRETLDLSPATVKYTTEDGTATLSNRDYVQEIGTLSFAQGEVTKQINVRVIGDLVGENDETFKVKLSGATGATLTVGEATGTILNDAKLSIAAGSVLEGDSGTSTLGLTVTLIEGPASGNVTVKYKTEDLATTAAGVDKATAGDDYVAISDGVELTFAPGETTKTASITINGDLTGENDEAFGVRLVSPHGASLVTDLAAATILNDAKFTFVQEGSVTQLKEGNSGKPTMIFKVKGSELAPGSTSVNFSTFNGTGTNPAVGGEDFDVTSGTLVFTSEGEVKEIVVPIIGDKNLESDEVFTVGLTGANRSHAAFPAAATGTILTDDILSISDAIITEGDSGSTKAIFTITLKDAVPGSQQLWIDFNTEDGTAYGNGSAGKLADYKTTSGTLKIAAGQKIGTIEVEVFGDLNYEAAEEIFKVALSNARYVDSNGQPVSGQTQPDIGTGENAPRGTGTIVNGTDTKPTISIADAKFVEGTSAGTDRKQGQFTLTLSEATDFDVEVDLSTIEGTAKAGLDFDALPAGTKVTIPAGSKTFTVTVPIVQDAIDEADETFSLKINSAKLHKGGTAEDLGITRDTAVGTIQNDEVYVVVDTPEVFTEGSNNTQSFLVFKVRLLSSTTNESVNAAQKVVVTFSTEDGTAISSGPLADFIAQTGAKVEIPAGQSEVEIKIAINGDNVDEKGLVTGEASGQESFNVKITDVEGAKLGATGAQTLSVVGTIQDDDPAPVITLSHETGGAGFVIEGEKAVFKVKLDRPTDHDIIVPYIIGAEGDTAISTGDNKDYTVPTTLQVVIPAGQTEATFTVNTVNDSLREGDETFKVKLGTLANTNATIGTGEVTATIHDNDPLPIISIGNVVVVEGDSPDAGKKAVFTVTLSTASAQPVKINYTTVDKDAMAGSDYVAKTGTLTIPAGSTTGTIEIDIIGDTVVEGDESFFVRLSQPTDTPATATIGVAQGLGTILTDETQYQVEFNNGSGAIEVTEENGTDEQTITFRIKRTGDLSKAGSVRFTTEDGSNALGDLFRNATGSGARADFDFASKVITFAPGAEYSEEIKITLNKDDYYEGSEQFRIRLSEPVNGAVSESNSKMGTVTILDNEERPTVSFEQTTVLLNEGNLTTSSGGTTAQQSQMVFKIKLSRIDETGTVTARLVTEDIEATSAASSSKKDYTAVATDITFQPGETEKTQSITILGDTRDEYDETFRVKLSELHGGGAKFVGDATELTAIGKILDDDAEAVVSITDLVTGSGSSFTGTTFAETDGNGTGKFFRVVLTGETDKVVTVKYYTVNGTAVAGADFVGITEAEAHTLTFDPNDANTEARTAQKIFIPVINDSVAENSETFEVKLKDVTGASLGNSTGTATIQDNDNPIVTIDDVELVEGDDPNSPVKARFTVRLAAAAEREVLVNFATQDGTAKSTGYFADFLAKQGQIKFAPGETTKEIEIDILGDIYQDGYYVAAQGTEGQEGYVAAHIVNDETFTVKLTGSGLTFAKDTGTGTIKNGNDSTIGVAVNDTATVENTYGANGKVSKNAEFTVELSVPYVQQSPAFSAALRSGTALKGVDFSDLTGTASSVTFAAGSTSAKFTVPIVADDLFETTEHFFLSLGQLPQGVQAARPEARGTIYSEDVRQLDARTIQWIDVDGDLVTLKVSKGELSGNNILWLPIGGTGTDKDAISISPTGGRTLQLLDVSSSQFQNANITITAEPQPGFTGDANGNLGDGRVNVGWIRAGNFINDGSFFGVDLGTVKVDGDLGRIDAGDRFVDSLAIRKLDVYSLGTKATEEGLLVRNQQTNAITGVNTTSFFLGPVGAINVETDLSGGIQVLGGSYGDIASVHVGGALKGTQYDDTGSIHFSGTLGKVVIGEIVGGTGARSGRVEGDVSYGANIGSITVNGDIIGDAAASGAVVASKIGSVLVKGGITGGDYANNATADQASGVIRAAVMGSVRINGDIVGGSGGFSGSILGDSGLSRNGVSKIGSVTVEGRLIGGDGNQSAVIRGGSFGAINIKNALSDNALPEPGVVGGKGIESAGIQAVSIGRVFVKGDLSGGVGNSSATIGAGSIGSVAITGNVAGGKGTGSGVIEGNASYAKVHIGKISVGGYLLGGEGTDSGAIHSPIIGSVRIGGDVVGGAGDQSGIILGGTFVSTYKGANKIGKVEVDGRVIGGAGDFSGGVVSLGNIGSVLVGGKVQDNAIPSLANINGAVTGGAGENSGLIRADGVLGSLKINAPKPAAAGDELLSLVGGSGAESGKITAGSIGKADLRGTIQGGTASATGIINVSNGIKSLVVHGDLKGGSSKAADQLGAVNTTGAIVAGRIDALHITGSVISGTDHGPGLDGSGSIAVQGPIGKLDIDGDILGNRTSAVSILAFGSTKEAAISKLRVGGKVEFTNITAGVSFRSAGQAGFPVNADAQIGTVDIGGDVKGLNITAGANTGADGIFGTADDQVLSNVNAQINEPKVYSRIASVIIRGQIQAVTDETSGAKLPYGIVAQQIGSVRYQVAGGGLVQVNLTPGAGNDKATSSSDPAPGKEVGSNTGFRAFELPIA